MCPLRLIQTTMVLFGINCWHSKLNIKSHCSVRTSQIFWFFCTAKSTTNHVVWKGHRVTTLNDNDRPVDCLHARTEQALLTHWGLPCYKRQLIKRRRVWGEVICLHLLCKILFSWFELVFWFFWTWRTWNFWHYQREYILIHLYTVFGGRILVGIRRDLPMKFNPGPNQDWLTVQSRSGLQQPRTQNVLFFRISHPLLQLWRLHSELHQTTRL